MRKGILEVYALAVCFFAVACFVFTLGTALYDLVEMAAPEFTLSAHEYERHQSDEAFKATGSSQHIVMYQDGERREETRSTSVDADIPGKREASFQRALRTERRDAAQSLVRMAIVMLINLLVFLAHWQIGQRVRRADAASAG